MIKYIVDEKEIMQQILFNNKLKINCKKDNDLHEITSTEYLEYNFEHSFEYEMNEEA